MLLMVFLEPVTVLPEGQDTHTPRKRIGTELMANYGARETFVGEGCCWLGLAVDGVCIDR
jgi:hypothetical protein